MKVQHALAALPFVRILVGMFFANSVEPYVLGLPFAPRFTRAVQGPEQRRAARA
jgi:hypothetical protein